MTASTAVPRTVGDELPERTFGPITMTDIVRYQGASGDLNPMHHDDDLARQAGYPQSFSVGMLGAGYLATVCTEVYGSTAVRRFLTQFRSVVYRGETLTSSVRVSDVVERDGETVVVLATRLVTGDGRVAVVGEAEYALLPAKGSSA